MGKLALSHCQKSKWAKQEQHALRKAPSVLTDGQISFKGMSNEKLSMEEGKLQK